ncbi:glucosaminidase domain-containing protein [Bacteroides ovatus]|uniref:glucosaminidase domain-containing protein n=1 Tax=Bacteroides ovatus TaxID=28116 RepID=UPI001F374140|nr:glucosaminidase domain-containing protein [Bacteroides ovatus]MCE8990090.1 glucosaminidase domain-containing protein [Bacteroides ovatus]
MRKKFIKSSRPTYKKRIKKAQQGMKFVNYNPVSNPTIDYTDITNPVNPFSEYNFNTVYDKPEALVVPVRDTNEPDVVANNPIAEPVINKPVASKSVTDKPVTKTANSTWKSPYTNRKQWSTELINAYKKAGITNDNAIRMLLAQDALESSWGKSAQGKYNFGNLTTGSSWKGDYVTGNDKNAKGEAIKQKFRSYNSMDEYAADKIQFLKRLYDFDENDDINKFVAKLTGSNKGKRRYAEATNYAKVLTGVYNGIPKGENGMIIKYQEPAHGIARRDAIKDYRPGIPLSPIKQPVKPYMPTQQPILSPDNRTGWEKEVSRQIKADRAKNDNLYGNQHTWNWSAPFTNARITKDNASAMFDFDKSAAMSTFAIGQGIASPVTTATSIAGSLVGAGIGNKVAGEKGALVGGFVGGLAGNKAFTTARNVSKNLGIVAKPFQGESNVTDNLIKFIGGHTKGTSISIDKLRGLEKYQAIKLQEAGVDLSRLSIQDLQKAINLRKQELVKSAPNGRVNIIRPESQFSGTQEVLDFVNDNGRFIPVGNTKLSLGDDILISNTENIATVPNVHKVEERALNSAIQLAQQTGRNGVRTGQELNSAPKTYNVWKHFNGKELVGNYGVHSNTNMINEAVQAGKLKNSLELDEEVLINSIDQMKGDASRRLLLLNGPVYRLTKQSDLPTKTKSVLFDPKIIDSSGKMHVDWSNPSIFKTLLPFTAGLNLMNNE